MKLQTLKPRLALLSAQASKAGSLSDRRVTGRRLQGRRFSMWKQSPYCADCGRLVAYPDGFELDHKVALMYGGEDTEANCQLLCVHYDAQGVKQGCHIEKTAQDLGHKTRA